jgi:hypothetical protein
MDIQKKKKKFYKKKKKKKPGFLKCHNKTTKKNGILYQISQKKRILLYKLDQKNGFLTHFPGFAQSPAVSLAIKLPNWSKKNAHFWPFFWPFLAVFWCFGVSK